MTRSDDLAASQAATSKAREQRVAAAHALRDFVRSGGTGSASLARVLSEARHDGTRMTLRADKPATNVAGHTNHADDVTSTPTPLSNRED